MFLWLSLLTTWSLGAAPATEPAPFTTKRALYCGALRVGFMSSHAEGLCVDPRRRQSYRLSVIGVGFSVHDATSVFRLRLDYDETRYDRTFDPFPGQYFVTLSGYAPGVTKIFASSGNKVLRANALNLGLGVDASVAALLVLRKLGRARGDANQ